jgi:chlorobactene glucosyltransferase
MNGHQASIIIFLGVTAAIALLNALALHRLGQYPAPARFPRVSILVPARNEERTIEACVRSLLAEDYPDFEVIVLDDGSGDSMPRILQGLAGQEPRLRVIAGAPVPEGWLGKHWACHQLAQAAGSALLLFTDADTRHAPSAVSEAVAALHAEKLDLLSAIPLEETRTLGEKLLVLPLLWSMMSFFPLPIAYWLRIPWLVVANGQFMLFERRAYQAIGGHAAVRDDVLDDVALAKLIVKKGLRFRLLDGTRHLRCRMYGSFGEAWAGFTKNLYAVFGNSVLLTLFVWCWLAVVHLEPLAVLAADTLGQRLGALRPDAALAAVVLALGAWVACYARLGAPVRAAFLYPMSVALYAVLALSSMWAHIRGRARWKGRPVRVRRVHPGVPTEGPSTGGRPPVR